jgi:hypothetical protein
MSGAAHDRVMSDEEGLRRIRPRNRRDWWQLISGVTVLVLVLAGLIGLGYALHRLKQSREQNWRSGIATVEDVRGQLAATFGAAYDDRGSAVLYNAQVLVRFQDGSSRREEWIPAGESPRRADLLEFDKRYWRGKSYPIRWNPADPREAVINLP